MLVNDTGQGLVAHSFNSWAWETQAERALLVQGHSGIHKLESDYTRNITHSKVIPALGITLF